MHRCLGIGIRWGLGRGRAQTEGEVVLPGGAGQRGWWVPHPPYFLPPVKFIQWEEEERKWVITCPSWVNGIPKLMKEYNRELEGSYWRKGVEE